MTIPAFVKQIEEPLFPKVFWNRPTMRSRGGRLLAIGGQPNELSLLQAVYQLAEAAGIGECQAAMPDSLRRLVGTAEFAHLVPASVSGSMGKAALGELLTIAPDFDALIIGMNLTTNAETGVMIESLINRLEVPVVVTEEAITILKFNPALITDSPKALVVTTMAGLFALANHLHMPIAIKPQAGVVAKMTILQQLVDATQCSYMVCDHEVLVAAEGKMSLTPLNQSLSNLTAAPIGVAATFWIQHRTQPFAALTTAAFVLAQATGSEKLSYSVLEVGVRQALTRFEQ